MSRKRSLSIIFLSFTVIAITAWQSSPAQADEPNYLQRAKTAPVGGSRITGQVKSTNSLGFSMALRGGKTITVMTANAKSEQKSAAVFVGANVQVDGSKSGNVMTATSIMRVKSDATSWNPDIN